jgi:hypothetical protein
MLLKGYPNHALTLIQLKDLHARFGLCDKVVTYVKDEGANFRHIHNYFNKHNFVCSINDNRILFCYLLWHAISKCC